MRHIFSPSSRMQHHHSVKTSTHIASFCCMLSVIVVFILEIMSRSYLILFARAISICYFFLLLLFLCSLIMSNIQFNISTWFQLETLTVFLAINFHIKLLRIPCMMQPQKSDRDGNETTAVAVNSSPAILFFQRIQWASSGDQRFIEQQ